MNNWIITTAEWMLVVEGVSVVVFVFFNYLIRLKNYYAERRKPYIEDNIKAIFFKCIQEKNKLSLLDRIYLERNMDIMLNVIESFRVSGDYFKEWVALKKELYDTIFRPMAKVLYRSWRPHKRYYAALYYLVDYDIKDEKIVEKLISDPILLVSINASRIAFKYESSRLINVSIDVFSKYRKIRQSIYVTIANECNNNVEKIVVERLLKEEDPYIKAFCYRLLQHLPSTESFDDEIRANLNATTLDLRLAALHYAGYNPRYNHFLGKYIDDEEWEMRAAAAQRIGMAKYMPALPALGMRITDHEWWVRIRTAEALGKLGEPGLRILREQSIEKDKYAYEAAMQVLSTFDEEVLNNVN